MRWDKLPNDIHSLIFYYRKLLTCGNYAASKIVATWRCYKTRILISRFKILRYLQEFRLFNPSLKEFLLRSKL